MPPTLYLIDGHALAYRTYFALSGSGMAFSTSSGEPTAGIYGFASVIMRILEQEKPEYLAVAFDTGKTFRNQMYAEYKATRAKMPEDLRPQIERIRQMMDAFDVPRIEVEGFEADDVLGSIARQAEKIGMGVKIITGDKDLLQLVNDRTVVTLPGSKLAEGKDYFAVDVKETLGVYPEQVIDYKALVGDHSDNYPGVPGIGEKTATLLLEQYETLDSIYAHLEEIPPRFRVKLEAGKQSAYLSKDLATIRLDVPVVLDIDKASTRYLNYPALEQIFRELEFRTLLTRLQNLKGTGIGGSSTQLDLFGQPVEKIAVAENGKRRTIVVTNQEELRQLVSRMEAAREFAFDTETSGLDPMSVDLVGISIALQEGEGFYVPVGHQTSQNQLPRDHVVRALGPVFKDEAIKKVGHNIKYDVIVLARNGCETGGIHFDTMIAEWLLRPDSRNLGLKDMAGLYLNLEMTRIEDLIGKGKNQTSMSQLPIPQVAEYAAADAEVTLRLKSVLQGKMIDPRLQKMFYEIEMPLVSVLASMEMAGISLDTPFLQQMSGELNIRLGEIETVVQKAAGYAFNLNSTQQLSKVLFETLKLEPPDRSKKTASGHYSTSAEVLDELVGKHEVVDLLLEYRELSKLRSTYVDSLPAQVNPKTGRVHTSFNQTGTVTGRVASSDPNLQNIPIRTEMGSKIRKAFIAEDGWKLLSVDYSQIELRIVAHMAGDEAMLNAFQAGQDIHTATAAAIHNVDLDQVTKEQRRQAKAINFGLIYGMSPFGLSRSTGITLAEAENFVKEYFHDFPGVRRYLDEIRQSASRSGYVETMLGRRRFFPNLKSGANPALRAREEREAINAPIQGTAADIIKIAMTRLPTALTNAGMKTRILLQVHDELVLEAPDHEVREAARVVRETMESAMILSIPLTTDARWGQNWGSMKSISELQ